MATSFAPEGDRHDQRPDDPSKCERPPSPAPPPAGACHRPKFTLRTAQRSRRDGARVPGRGGPRDYSSEGIAREARSWSPVAVVVVVVVAVAVAVVVAGRAIATRSRQSPRRPLTTAPPPPAAAPSPCTDR